MVKMPIRTRLLGNSRQEISIISQGSGGLGGYFTPDASEDQNVIHALRFGIELGMNFIDTAEIYGGGHTEEIIARAIEGRRSEVIIGTKFSPENSAAQSIQVSVEQSLRRLNTDYIDLYQTHWTNPNIPYEETLEAMKQLVEQGKVRWLGLSNPSSKGLSMAIDALGFDKLVSIQVEYNILERTAEAQLLPLCDEANLTFFAFSPLLSGRAVQEHKSYPKLLQIASKYGVSVQVLMLAWVVDRENVVAIPRSSKLPHIQENAQAGCMNLDANDVKVISRLFDRQIKFIETSQIDVASALDRDVYKTLEEAKENKNKMVPSPSEIAEEFISGEVPKPIKLRKLENGRYALIEGRLKYWGWVIAFGTSRPIQALIENE